MFNKFDIILITIYTNGCVGKIFENKYTGLKTEHFSSLSE